MSKKPRGVLVLAGTVVVVVALALVKLASFRTSPKNGDKPGSFRDRTVAVRVEIVRQEKLEERIATVGTILPNEEVEIRSETSGKIEDIFFDEGSRVHKGNMLIKINDDELQAQLLRADSRRALAEQQERRVREMFEQRLVSQEDYDRALSELNVVKAEVQLTKAQIDKTEIRAPFGGMIGLRYVSKGSYISPATRIATLQDNRQMKIDFAVPERYAGMIKEGDRIDFNTPGAPGVFTGVVYALESKIDPATRTLRVRAFSPNSDGVLAAGAFASIEVFLKEKEAVTVPAYALVPELKGNKVFLYRGGKAAAQSVEIGVRGEERVEITRGVQAGDTLITSAVLQLRPGTTVRVVE